MSHTAISLRTVIMAALALGPMGLVGCNSDSGGTAPLPPSSALPPPPPKELLDANGKPKSSTAAFDTARGAQPPK